jgi:peptidoglycan hydrolase-like protein with peptidoglycan-binding domain
VYFASDIVVPGTIPEGGGVTKVSFSANMSRSGVIAVTAQMPARDFNTLFAK